MRNAIRLGKIFGIEIDLDYSWLLIFALVTWSLAQRYLDVNGNWPVALRWALAVITSLLFFASVLAHELAHSLVSKAEGIPVPRITLFIFGGASQIAEQPRRPLDEFRMAIVGPLTSLGLAIVFGVAWYLTRDSSLAVSSVAGWLGGINASLAVFNLLPGFPLDGGRVLRSIVWGASHNLRLATRVAVIIGMLMAWALIALGLWLVLGGGDLADGLWIAFIGWFLQNAASQEGQFTVVHDLLQGHTVREVLDANCPRVLKQLTLDVFFENYVVPSGRRCFVVMEGDKFLGLVTMHRLQAVPRNKWQTTHIGDVMLTPDRLIATRPDEDLTAVLDKMGQADVNQLPVFEGDRFLGLVTRANILAFLRAHAQQRGVRPAPA
jgi:Zn-dependent protease/CBS domain-containing protein